MIYNALGQKIAEPVNKESVAGNYEVNFDAGSLSSGVYYYKITVNDYSAVKKMILLR